MIHTMTVKQPYFNMLRDGHKTIELRLYDSKRQQIRPGDKIQFVNGDDQFMVKVTGMVRAENFKSLFNIIDVKKTGLEENEKAINIMKEFYDDGAQAKFGVVGIIVKKED